MSRKERIQDWFSPPPSWMVIFDPSAEVMPIGSKESKVHWASVMLQLPARALSWMLSPPPNTGMVFCVSCYLKYGNPGAGARAMQMRTIMVLTQFFGSSPQNPVYENDPLETHKWALKKTQTQSKPHKTKPPHWPTFIAASKISFWHCSFFFITFAFLASRSSARYM